MIAKKKAFFIHFCLYVKKVGTYSFLLEKLSISQKVEIVKKNLHVLVSTGVLNLALLYITRIIMKNPVEPT